MQKLDIALSTAAADDDSTANRLLEHFALTEGLSAWHLAIRHIESKRSLDDIPESFGDVLFDFDQTAYSTRYALLRHTATGGLICFRKQHSLLYIYPAAQTPSVARDIVKETEAFLPVRPPLPEGQKVNVGFWTLTPNGPRYIERVLGVNRWEELEQNYIATTRTQVEKLMIGFRPTRAGQLILWYGAPGTGKTHALRALMWEWRRWCQFAYITDPDQLFGAHANYLIDVLLKANQLPDSGPSGDDDPTTTVAKLSEASPWTCLILEDSGELMSMDAKQQTGQGLSRLLNVVDGLIGQGLKIMVLVTTNEALKKLHPAVARPGRCGARIEFVEFTAKDAEKWLENHQLAPHANASALPLCDLYERLEETQKQIVAEKKSADLGFITN
jgi:hypothetical protein